MILPKSKIISVHQPQYIPWLGFFDKIDKSDAFVFLDQVQYKTREFQNRNKIRIKDKWIWLAVPVKTKGQFRQIFFDVLINNDEKWASNHIKSLKAWYSKAPFFKDYFPFFEDTLSKKWGRLIDLNVFIIKYILYQLKINTPLYFETDLKTTKVRTERIIEICHKLDAKIYLSGQGGKGYLDEKQFHNENLKLHYQRFSHPVYTQQFESEKQPFIPFMSIVDLLFNLGAESINVIRQTYRVDGFGTKKTGTYG